MNLGVVTAADRAAATCLCLRPGGASLPGLVLIKAKPPKRGMSAAALSAAVDLTNLQETAPTLHGGEPPKEQPSLFPAALRERARGRGFLQRSRLPRSFPHVPPALPCNSFDRAGMNRV